MFDIPAAPAHSQASFHPSQYPEPQQQEQLFIPRQSQPLVIRLPDTTTIDIEACSDELLLDVKQVLSEVLPTCFYTNFKFACNGRIVSELADVKSLSIRASGQPHGHGSTTTTTGHCILDIVPKRYGDRSLRVHVRRTAELLFNPEVPILNSSVIRPAQLLTQTEHRPVALRDRATSNSTMVSQRLMSEGLIEDASSSTKKKKRKKKKKNKNTTRNEGLGVSEKDFDFSASIHGKHQTNAICSSLSPSSTRKASPISTVDPEYFGSFFSGSPPLFDVKVDFVERIMRCGSLSDVESVKRLTIKEIGINKPSCVLSIKSSEWNPPTNQYRLRGDLRYLEILTLEFKCLLVIGQETGFLVAAEMEQPSDANCWNPSKRPATFQQGVDRFWTLHELLKAKSPKYASTFNQLAIDCSPSDPNLSYHISCPATPYPQWIADPRKTVSSYYSNQLDNSLERGTESELWETVREWNEELQYSRELPRTDANLFTNQRHLRQRSRTIKKQQANETRGAPFSLIIEGDEKEKEEQQGCEQPCRLASSIGVMFKAEDAAIIRDRNLCKLSSQLRMATAQGAIQIREGKIVSLDNAEDPMANLSDDSTFTGSCPSGPSNDLKVYAWNNLFFVQSFEIPEPSPTVRNVEDTHFEKEKTERSYSNNNSNSHNSSHSHSQTVDGSEGVPSANPSTAAVPGTAAVDLTASSVSSLSFDMESEVDSDCALATYFCTRRGMLSDVRASELVGQFESVQPVAFARGLYYPTSASSPSSSTAPSTPEQSSSCKRLEKFRGADAKESIRHDVQRMETMLSLEESRVTNLYSLALSLVDYAGRRVLCQTIIPGMLSGELNSRPVYGAASLGEAFATDPVSEKLLRQYVQRPLGLKTHILRDCTGTEIVCGVPVECKVLEGIDHRRYINDLSRVLPIDLNGFTHDEIQLLIHAQNAPKLTPTESMLRQRSARKTCTTMVRPRLFAAYLYQASKKTAQLGEGVFDWNSYRLKVPPRTPQQNRDRELRAKAIFEWVKMLGLQFCSEFIADVPSPSIPSVPSARLESTTTTVDDGVAFPASLSDPMLEWPGLELFLVGEPNGAFFQWDRLALTLNSIAHCVAHKISYFHALSLREQQQQPTDDDPSQRPRPTDYLSLSSCSQEVAGEETNRRDQEDFHRQRRVSSSLDCCLTDPENISKRQMDTEPRSPSLPDQHSVFDQMPYFLLGNNGCQSYLSDRMPVNPQSLIQLHDRLRVLTQNRTTLRSSNTPELPNKDDCLLPRVDDQETHRSSSVAIARDPLVQTTDRPLPGVAVDDSDPRISSLDVSQMEHAVARAIQSYSARYLYSLTQRMRGREETRTCRESLVDGVASNEQDSDVSLRKEETLEEQASSHSIRSDKENEEKRNAPSVNQVEDQRVRGPNHHEEMSEEEEEEDLYFLNTIDIPSLFNPNISNLSVDVVGDQASRQIDVLQLENLATYVKDVALPRLVDHLIGTLDEPPLESTQLSSLFHAFGINMRYLGDVAFEVSRRWMEAQKEADPRVVDIERQKTPSRTQGSDRHPSDPDEHRFQDQCPLLVQVLEREILTRCITYQFHRVLINYSLGELADVTAYMFNLLISPLPIALPQLKCPLSDTQGLPSPQNFWASVESRAFHHFRYVQFKLSQSFYINTRHHRYPIIRTICHKVGIQLTPVGLIKIMKSVAHDTEFDPDSILGTLSKSSVVTGESLLPRDPGRKKTTVQSHLHSTTNSSSSSKKKQTLVTPSSADESSVTSTTDDLTIEDIYGFVPILKSHLHVPSAIHLSLSSAITAHALDLFEVAFECHQQCVQILHQMNLPVSKEVLLSQCCTAFVLINLGDILAASLYLQKVVLLIEKLHGPDHPTLIPVYVLIVKLSVAIITSTGSTRSTTGAEPQGNSSTPPLTSSSSSVPPTHQMLIQLHQLNIGKDALEKAVSLAKLWTGCSHRSSILSSLLIQTAKVAFTSMSFISMLQHQASSIQLDDFSVRTQKAIKQMVEALPSFPLGSSGPMLVDADRVLSILHAISEMLVAMKKSRAVTLYTIAHLESELSTQFLVSGETRRALDSARRQRDILVELLGPSHIEVQVLDRHIGTLTRHLVVLKRHSLMAMASLRSQ